MFDYDAFEEKRGSDDHQLVVNENLIRMAKVAEARCKGEKNEPTADALVQLAAHTLHTDVTLALGYLLALPQVSSCNLLPLFVLLVCFVYVY